MGWGVVGVVLWRLHVQGGPSGSLAPHPKDSGASPLGECVHVHACVRV